MTTSKIVQALHSRTVWATIVMLVFNFLPQLNVDQSFKDLINSVLVLLISYFHLNPLQQGTYTPAGVPPPVMPPIITPAPTPIPSPSTPVI